MSKLLPILLLIAGLAISILLISTRTSFFSKAGVSDQPQNIRISNISDNSITISWITALKVPGFINFGVDQNLGSTVLDDRDLGGNNVRFTHHVTLENLNPATTYMFKIGSGSTLYDDQGKLFTQTTAPITNETPPLPETLFGKVTKSDGQVPKEALVFMQTEKGTVLSSFTRTDGNFLITLNNARTADLFNYLTFKDEQKIKLEVLAGEEGKVEKELVSTQKGEAQDLVLEKVVEVVAASWPADLNNDSVVNSIDFAIFVKQKLGL